MLFTYDGLVAEVERLQAVRVSLPEGSRVWDAACDAERRARGFLARTPEQKRAQKEVRNLRAMNQAAKRHNIKRSPSGGEVA